MENNFDVLEEKVRKAVEVVKRLRKENKDLHDQVGKAQPRLEELEKKIEAMDKQRGAATAEAGKMEGLAREVKELRHEREEIKKRIGRIVEALDALE